MSGFYIGYLQKAPSELRKPLRRIVFGLFMVSAAVACALILAQAPFAVARFEFQQFRPHTGIVREWPYPALLTQDSHFLLVDPGKRGASASISGMEGRSVQLEGALIQRGSQRMLELRPGSLAGAARPAHPQTKPVALGRVRLRGEIVDSKCYLGVMNPGSTKVHRDCAVRCISGGIPPGFAVRDSAGNITMLLLVGSGRARIGRRILPFIGEPVEISGELLRDGAWLLLSTDPSGIRRLE